MKKILVVFLGLSILLSGCGTAMFAKPTPTATITPPPPTSTVVPSATPTVIPTATITPSPTAFLVFQGPKKVYVPIFLYHYIDVPPGDSEYYVSPEMFDREMKLLHDWGYSTISTELLIKAINEGADLPPRPMLITFDDGHLDNYTNAFPIMKKYGFTGVLYIVANYMGADQYMNIPQIQEMGAAGWEVGSHSVSHAELTKIDATRQRYEVVDSRVILEANLDLPILTFAYPWGIGNSAVIDYVHYAGYIGAMGLGYTYDQGSSNLYTLQRRGISGKLNIQQFADLLPWKGDPAQIPTEIPPTP